jgi:hypothetical protein
MNRKGDGVAQTNETEQTDTPARRHGQSAPPSAAQVIKPQTAPRPSPSDVQLQYLFESLLRPELRRLPAPKEGRESC